MKIEKQKDRKTTDAEILARFNGTFFPLKPLFNSSDLAKIKGRIVRQKNDYHKPIFISINNK